MQLEQTLSHRLAFFLPFMLVGLAFGFIDLPFASSRLLSTVVSLVILWLLSRQLTRDYDPGKATPLHKAALSLLAGFTFSMFWAATSWFPEGSQLLSAFSSVAQAVLIGFASIGLVLAIWHVFSKCVGAFFGDIIADAKVDFERKKRGR